MRLQLSHIVLAGILTSAAVLTASAQETPTPAPPAPVVEFVQDGYTYDYPGDQPLVVYVEGVNGTKDGTWATVLVLARLSDGSVTRLTPCNDREVMCAPITGVEGTLDGAAVGDAFVLDAAAVNAE